MELTGQPQRKNAASSHLGRFLLRLREAEHPIEHGSILKRRQDELWLGTYMLGASQAPASLEHVVGSTII